MITTITVIFFLIGVPTIWGIVSTEIDSRILGFLSALVFGMTTIFIGFFINWCLLRFLVQETPDAYIETQLVIAQYSILEDDYIVPTSSGTLRIPIKQTIIQPSDSAELETHYLQQEYSDGAEFLCAPFAIDGPVIDYYVLKINNS